MASLDDAWPRGGRLSSEPLSAEEEEFRWDIGDFLRRCLEERRDSGAERKRVRSVDFSFGRATWNLFFALDQEDCRCRFGFNVRTHRAPGAHMDIYFRWDIDYEEEEEEEDDGDDLFETYTFKCGSGGLQWKKEDILSDRQLEGFLLGGDRINCRFRIHPSRDEEIDVEDFWLLWSDAAVEGPPQTQLSENDGGDMPKISHVRRLSRDLKQLLLSGEESDTTVRVQGQPFRAHRAILVARSPVFASMFRHDMKERATGVVDLEDCEATVFPVLLEYLYCGSTENISADNVFGLYTSADMYDVPELKSECLEFIRKNLSVDTFCETVKLSLQHSEEDLLQLSIDYFARNRTRIVKSVDWQNFASQYIIQAKEIYKKASKLRLS